MVVVLPTPLTPDEQPDVGHAGLDAQGAVGDGEALLEVVLQGVDQQLGGLDVLGLDLGPELVEQGGGGGDADVGPDQGLLQLLPRLVVDLGAGADGAQVAGQQAAGLAQAVAEAGLDGAAGGASSGSASATGASRAPARTASASATTSAAWRASSSSEGMLGRLGFSSWAPAALRTPWAAAAARRAAAPARRHAGGAGRR